MTPSAQLTPDEKKDLELCGITTAEQLQRVSPEQLWQDLQKMVQYFPQHRLCITRERLEELCQSTIPADAAEPMPQKPEPTSGLRIVRQPAQTHLRHNRGEELPEGLADLHGVQKAERLSRRSHSIRCKNPFLTYLGAFTTLLLLIPLSAFIVIPLLIIQGVLTNEYLLPVVLAVVATAIPYVIISRFTSCPVCHINLYSFRDFPRNKSAHKIPLLGYTFGTALHVFFCLNFYCPACGTRMRIFSKGKR